MTSRLPPFAGSLRPVPLAALLLGCAGAPAAAPAEPALPPLAQTLPLGGRATYGIVDSVRVEADGERVRFRTEVAYSAEVRLRFRTSGDTLLATATLSALEGTLRNPTTGTATVGLGDVDGDWVFAVGRDGEVTSLETPAVTGGFREIVGTEDIPRTLFISLPDGPAVVGTEWVDTVRLADEGAGVRRRTTIIGRSRVAERALAAGRPVLIVESVLDVSIEAESGAGSDEPTSQVLRGSVRRRATWDAGLRRLTHYRATGRLTGELRVDGLDAIPLTADVVREVTGS